MSEHAFVCWLSVAAPWELESELIGALDLPLNLDQNQRNAFHLRLTERRAACRERAKALPVVGS